MDDTEATRAAIDGVLKLMKDLEMPVSLKNSTKLTKNSLDEMLEYVLNERQFIYNLPAYNPRRLTKENLQILFDDIWEGKFSFTT
jgi:alcohol dehydrogenase class IV